jgi:hypothetical protein
MLMLRYFPLDAGVTFETVRSDLIGFDWQNNCADFLIPGDEANVLRVSFTNNIIVRMLDEFALSTETEPATWEGLVPNHFAYRVDGDIFLEAQSKAWKHGTQVEHYRFITGSGCLDVVTSLPPDFAVIPKP